MFSKKQNSQSSASSYRAKRGALGSALTAGVIALAVAVNAGIRALPATITQWDVSEQQLYKLSDTTKDFLSDLTKDVVLYYVCSTGNEIAMVTNTMDRFASYGHVKWEQIDPAIYPNFMSAYEGEDAPAGSTVVVCGDRYKVISSSDYYKYEYNYQMGGFQPTDLDAENQFISAIQYVTSDTGVFPKVYLLTGHGETPIYGTFTGALAKQNTKTESLSLFSVDALPEDASAIVINSPTVDFAKEDIAILRTYLEEGGSLLVTTNAQTKMPNLEALLTEYGMANEDGVLVEGNDSYHLRGYSYYLMPDVKYAESSAQMDKNIAVLAPFARAIKLDSTVESVTVKPLLQTSEQAYNKTGFDWNAAQVDLSRAEGDETGCFTLAAQAEKTLNDGKTARIVWINSGAMLTDDADSIVGGSNGMFGLGCITWLSKAESAALVGSKYLQSETLVFNALQVKLMTILFIAVIPVLLLAAGVIILIRRRNR